MQISSQLFTFVFPPIAYAFLVKEKPVNALGLKNSKILWFLIGTAMIFAIMPLNSILAEWNAGLKLPESLSALEQMMKQMQESASAMIEKFVSVDTIGGLMLNLFMIAGLAALGEELLFRSIIQTSLIKICKNAHVGILIASAIFSFIHLEFYGFVPRLILGMLLGYMFYFSGSIWVPMLMHFLNNGTVVLIYFLNNKGITNIDVDTFGQTSIPILIVSIVVMIALFLFSIKYSDKERTIAGN
jgi:membrane protease YdiL (CAAX protease family)